MITLSNVFRASINILAWDEILERVRAGYAPGVQNELDYEFQQQYALILRQYLLWRDEVLQNKT